MRMIAGPVSARRSPHEFEDLRLDGHVQRGGRLVSNQEPRIAGERHRDHHALAHAAGELVRIVARAALRRGDAYLAQHFDRLVAPSFGEIFRWRAAPRRPGRLRKGGIQRGHRLLKDHRELVAAQVAHAPLGALSRSSPSNSTSPSAMRPGGCGTSPMIESAVTLLPQPDCRRCRGFGRARATDRRRRPRAPRRARGEVGCAGRGPQAGFLWRAISSSMIARSLMPQGRALLGLHFR